MSLFQHTVLKQYISLNQSKIEAAYELFRLNYLDAEKQKNIRCSKEEQYQEGFLRDVFAKVFGYILNPEPNFNLITEKKNETNAEKADASILVNGEVRAVVELKGCDTTDLKSIEKQAFGYKHNNRNVSYVITSNFQKLRFYIENTIDFREWNLFSLSQEDFSELWLCLAYENLASGLPKKIKEESVSCEDQITKQFYRDYSDFKKSLFSDLISQNTSIDKLTLFKNSQKLLDRLLFIFFAEDSGLLAPNTTIDILNQWETLKELNAYCPLYDRFKQYFGYLNLGYKDKTHSVFGYNGGLFKPDEILDSLEISDELLKESTRRLSEYDFKSDVDVNILGHIFEHSLTEIENITQELTTNETVVSKRKKDGVFYTPKYITTYIVENTLGKLCLEKKQEIQIDEAKYYKKPGRHKHTIKNLVKKLDDYRKWLFSLTICDPACGSGAFLNAALDFLIAEHRLIDEMGAKLDGYTIKYSEFENDILEKNLYGVDINEESVEIAKLSLWLKTAKPGRKLNSLNENIKCGNSLISDPDVAGDKAFDWHKEFPHVFENGGFDIVMGNPPYGGDSVKDKKLRQFLESTIGKAPDYNIFYWFIDKSHSLLKEKGTCSFIIPNTILFNLFAKNYRMNLFNKWLIEEILDCTDFVIFEDATVRNIIFRFSKQENTDKLTYCPTKDITDFNLFVSRERETVTKTIVERNNHNWGLLFKLSQATLSVISKIRANFFPLESFFSETSQGLIAYDKYQGQSEEIIKSRAYHTFEKTKNSHKKWIYGEDITRYSVEWNGKEYIEYCDGIANPRDPKFFVGKRILIREITNPRLFAAITDTELYNDPSVLIVKDDPSGGFALECLLAILNSQLATYYHFNSSPKATKGAFPKILVNDINCFPIPKITAKQQKNLITLTEKMLSLNADLQNQRQRFLKRLADNFEGIRITTALSRFDEMDFKLFLAELKKQKINLSLKVSVHGV